MGLSINTPALLFPAISLLLLAYTNRFIALASLIRNLHAQYQKEPTPVILNQIKNLRMRVKLIRDMQTLGISSIFLCVFCMFLVYKGYQTMATFTFVTSLVLLMVSLAMSIWEIHVSTRALYIELSDIEDDSSHFEFNKITKILKPNK